MCKAYRKMRLFLCPFGACGAQKWLFRGVRGVALSKRFFPKPISEIMPKFATDFEIKNKK